MIFDTNKTISVLKQTEMLLNVKEGSFCDLRWTEKLKDLSVLLNHRRFLSLSEVIQL